MTPTERLEAAIAKLEAQRDASTPGPWGRYADGILMGIESESAALVYRTVVQAGEVRVADADLIVSLHRTIDAQLAILWAARADTEYGREPSEGAVGLADAILGGAS